jgi:tagaturonate epimerase
MTTRPQTLGLKRSFGFGDRLGLATAGHLAALGERDFAPIFAQQSIREMARTQRTPEQVMSAATAALETAGYTGAWGADADHLKTPEDVHRTAAAGFTFFTIDPSEYVNNAADTLPVDQLKPLVDKMLADGIFDSPQWAQRYLGQSFDIAGESLRFTQEQLHRAAVKYARAIHHSATMSEVISRAASPSPGTPGEGRGEGLSPSPGTPGEGRGGGRAYEIEVSVDETDSPTSPLEHLFFALELRRRNVTVVSLAPRFIGEMEKGIDYRGDLGAFERSLQQHVAIARHAGPYKISVHSGSDKFAIYPVVGRVCGELLHVKTAGTSYLEALRVIVRTDPALFREIAAFCKGRFTEDRRSYHISTTEQQVNALPLEGEMERLYLDEIPGRQLLHVTFGSVLTSDFKPRILDVLHRQESLHQELLRMHFDKHLRLLSEK